MNPPTAGETISNNELKEMFGVGNMGGMRRSLENKCLVIVSDHTKSLYDDRWEGNILHYTGMGMSGDQKLASQNRTLSESGSNGVAVHLFEVHTSGQYRYAGEVSLADAPYQENQIGEDGRQRLVWMFPVKLSENGIKPTPTEEELNALSRLRERALRKLSKEELKRRATVHSPTKPPQRPANGKRFVRNEAVSAYVKASAKGQCDLCAQPAPFNSKDGDPFLECHHIKWLAKGGIDHPSNAVALCPNCHRKMHNLDRKKDRQVLVNRVHKRDPDIPPYDKIP